MPLQLDIVTALKPGELRYIYNGHVTTLAIGSGFAEINQTKVVVLTDMALGEAEINVQAAEDAIQRAQEKLQNVEHSMAAEEVAYLQGVISKSTAAIQFKRKAR